MDTHRKGPPDRSDNIKRIKKLTLEANTDLLDIEADYKNDIDATELENFKASLYNIERETYAAYTDMCIWKASNTSPPAGISGKYAAAVETKQIAQQEAQDTPKSE